MGEERPLELNGKKYISAKRAAKDFGYTTDYIGQLSRGGKIDSVRVGRDRFVDIESLSRYVENISSEEKTTGTITASLTPTTSKDILIDSNERVVPFKKSIDPVVDDNVVLNGSKTKIRISPLRDNSPERVVSFKKIFAGALALVIVLMVAFPALDGSSVVSDQSDSTQASSISALNKIDNVYMNFLHKIDRVIVSIWNNLRRKTLALLSPILGDNTKSTVVVNNSQTLPSGTVGVSSVEELKNLTVDLIDQELAKTIDYAEEAKKNSNGMVVTPSTGSPTGDEALKKAIAKKFSDKVVVSVDPSGESGTIQPIFKNQNDGTYLYVLVPSIK